MSPVQHGTPGSGIEEPLGSGKGTTVGVTHPGADTTECPGVPGEVCYGQGAVVVNEGRSVTSLRVTNTGDRPASVGSHYHFAEVNEALEFDREAAWGKRLNILSGGMIRIDPGMVQEVELVPFAGDRIAAGFRKLCGGRIDG
jgi:urease subunit beta